MGAIRPYYIRYTASNICVMKARLDLKLFFLVIPSRIAIINPQVIGQLMSNEKEPWITRKQLLKSLCMNEHALRSCLPLLSEGVHYRRKNPVGSRSHKLFKLSKVEQTLFVDRISPNSIRQLRSC